MTGATDPLLIMILLVNFSLLGTSRMRAAITASAVQGLLLGAVTLVAQQHLGVRSVLVAVAAMVLKAFVIPFMLRRAMRDVAIRREVEPIVGYIPSLILGGVSTGLALVFARTLPLAPQHAGSLLVPTSLATVLTGFILLATRRKAITQVVGYLILENGIFVMGLTLVEAIPFLVEIGVLLDLFVGIFVMGIIVNHISRTFESFDTDRLRALKD